jgi:hypothetical protein
VGGRVRLDRFLIDGEVQHLADERQDAIGEYGRAPVDNGLEQFSDIGLDKSTPPGDHANRRALVESSRATSRHDRLCRFVALDIEHPSAAHVGHAPFLLGGRARPSLAFDSSSRAF